MKGTRAFLWAMWAFAAVCLLTAAFNEKAPSERDASTANPETDVQSPVQNLSPQPEGDTSPGSPAEADGRTAPPSEGSGNGLAGRRGARSKGPSSQPLIALVIDDMGFNFEMAEKIEALGLTTTWAVIPGTPRCGSIVSFSQKNGQPFILHVPMQALIDPAGSGYAVGVDTKEKEIGAYVQKLYRDYPRALGVNNHRGSKATSDPRTMEYFMKALSSGPWGFLDSRTSGKSVAYQTALGYDIPAARNNAFIDGSSDLETMKAQFSKALRHARKHGTAVAICHARKSTLPFLEYLTHADIKPVAFAAIDEIWERQRAYHKEETQ